MKRTLTLLGLGAAVAAALGACSDAPTATRILRQNGYSEIEITGYKPFSCSESDSYHTGFRAKAPGGGRVEGVVCSALFKGATIRFD